MDEKEVSAYVTRAVADIARKCHCSQDEVWNVISRHEHFKNK